MIVSFGTRCRFDGSGGIQLMQFLRSEGSSYDLGI